MYFIVKNQCEQAAAKLLEVCFFKHDRWVGSLREKTIFFLCLRWHVKKGGVTSRLHQITYIYIPIYLTCFFFDSSSQVWPPRFWIRKTTPKAPTKTMGRVDFFQLPPKKNGLPFLHPKGAQLIWCLSKSAPDFEVDENKIGILRTFFFCEGQPSGIFVGKIWENQFCGG